jgi:hypothetical protein
MTVADLQKILRAVDPAAVLVSSRIVERVIREDCKLPNMAWNIPHAKSYVCDRQCLFRHAEQADLELEPDQLLPDTVILLTRPDAEELSNLERQVVLLKYWRRLFHARVHIALAAANLSDEAIRDRVEQIGRTEFEEIRSVLAEDRYLPAGADDRGAFVEFAAVYLELRYFASSLLQNVFPGVRDFGKIERLLARDVNAAELFVKTRLRDAPDPIMTPETRSDESQEAYWKLVRAAQNAALSGNIVRAAILRMRASRIAPAAQTLPTRLEAEADIASLTTRLAQALGLSETEKADWTRHLTLLLDKADQGTSPTEAKVLAELQKACLDHEREIFTLDLVECVLSGGRRPIKRPLPSQRLVRITKHLRAASGLLQDVRLSDTDRSHLSRLLQSALHKSEDSLRARFAPVLTTAMEDVGLRPRTPTERAAFDKMVAELLDRIIQYGYLTFGELRDTISRNQLKLPDVSEPEHFVRGDPLIRLDRRLGSLLDGVYRPGEFYVRYLERGTSLLFGTWWGRWVTRYVLGPFLLAWVILLLLGLLTGEFNHWFFHSESQSLQAAAVILTGPAIRPSSPAEEPAAEEATADAAPVGAGLDLSTWWHFGLLALLGLYLLGLLHNAAFRRRCYDVLVAVGRTARVVLVDWPLRIIPIAAIRRLVSTWVFQLLYWYILKPAVLTLLLLLPRLDLLGTWWALSVFVVVNLAVNSQFGRAVSESFRSIMVQFGVMLRAGLLGGLVNFSLYIFKQAVEFVEYLLFSVDEWLRFRSGDGKVSLVVRTLLGVVWFPISFLTRFYMVVLIEPCINPIKLPLSILAAKVVYPMLAVVGWFDPVALDSPLIGLLAPYLTRPVAWLAVVATFWLLPDAFAFLTWEIKENWSLYRANRNKVLAPAHVGPHGETVRGLLQPGFHSGTVPALFSRLRQAEREATRTRNWQKARLYRHEMEDLEELLHRFLDRALVAPLRQSRSWRDELIEAGRVQLATNRIRFELTHAAWPATPVEIEIEHHHRWLLAGIRHPGWLERLSAEQQRAFATCLAGLYKLADVDLVREQLLASLPAAPTAARLTDEGLQVWWQGQGEPSFYPLRSRGEGPERDELKQRLLFSRLPITWEQWVACWQSDQEGRGHPGLPGVSELVLPRSVTIPPPATETSPVAPAPITVPASAEVAQENPA